MLFLVKFFNYGIRINDYFIALIYTVQQPIKFGRQWGRESFISISHDFYIITQLGKLVSRFPGYNYPIGFVVEMVQIKTEFFHG